MFSCSGVQFQRERLHRVLGGSGDGATRDCSVKRLFTEDKR